MIRIDIRPVWRFRSGAEREFDFRLIAILDGLEATGKLTEAARNAQVSYRHAWNLIREWERFFSEALVEKARGRGTQLTPLGKRLLLAGRRAEARLAPELQNLAADFERSLNASFEESANALAMHASHDFAVAALRQLATDAHWAFDLQYKGSFDAIAALRRRECDVAGFHLPEGSIGEPIARRYAKLLPGREFRLLGFVRRTQGFIVHAGNPKRIHRIEDLARDDVRMVNRQRGSGTRALMELLLDRACLDRERLRGYDDEETTHAAVAALIAGAQADVGFGVQAAAQSYGLGFVPVCHERYYLACRVHDLATPAIQALRAMLATPAFRARVASLAGYSALDASAEVSPFARARASSRAKE
ncbi:MAG: substrate-binding domain-containing protein [Bacillota bacterium]